MSTTTERKELRAVLAPLGPYAGAWLEFYQSVVGRLRSLKAEELAALERAAGATNQTNCAWYEYEAAQLLRREIPAERRRRLAAPSSKPGGPA